MFIESEIVELLIRFTGQSHHVFADRLRSSGITAPQIMILKEIYEKPKTIGQIVESMQLSYSTVSGIVSRLERDGWLERIRDERDRRIVWIRKTEQVDHGARKSMLYRETFYASLLKGLTERELGILRESMQILNRQMGNRTGEKS